MIIDVLSLLFIIFLGFIGFRRGTAFSVLHIGTTMVALFIAKSYYLPIAERLELFLPYPKTQAYDITFAISFTHLETRFYHIIAFIVIASLAKLIFYAIIVTFDNLILAHKLSKMSRGIGVIVSIFAASIYLVPLLYITSLYPNAWIQSQLTSSIIAKQLITQLPILSQFVVNI